LWLIAPDKNATVHTDWPQIDVFTTDINQPRYTASGYKFTLNTEESAVNKITIDGKDVTEKFRILVRCGKPYNGLPYNYGVSIGIDINVPMVNNIDITSLLAEKPCEAIVRMSSAIAVKLDNLSSTESKSVEFKGKFQRPITLSLANGKKLLLGRIESTSDVKVSAATGSELYIESVLGKNMRITGAKDCKIIIDNLILEEYLKARFERNGTLTLHQGSCKEIEFEIFNESKLMFNSLIKTELFKVRVGKKSTLEMTGDVSKTLIKELELDMGKSSFAIFKAAIGCLLQSSLCPGANANISVLDNKPDECETYKNCLIKDGTYQIYNDAEVVDDEY
jgi:hypothetical protein